MTRLEKLPYFISYFLGYRKPNRTQKILPRWRVLFWSFIAAWLGIALLEIMFTYSSVFQAHNAPMIVASFGATAVLAYGAIDSPLAQPRNIFCGHVIGSLTGVIIAQLFLNIQHNWASEAQLTAVQWVGGATAMAMALNIMQFTKTVHPPAGATALIAVVTPNIIELSWYYIGIVAVSAVIQICVACLVNNAEKRYPQYWWTPETPIKLDPANLATVMPAPVSAQKGKDEIVLDNLTAAEEGRLKQQNSSGDSSLHSSSPTSNSGVDLAINTLQNHVFDSHTPYVLVTPGAQLSVTPGLLDDSEQETLKALLQKLNTSTLKNPSL